LFDLLGG